MITLFNTRHPSSQFLNMSSIPVSGQPISRLFKTFFWQNFFLVEIHSIQGQRSSSCFSFFHSFFVSVACYISYRSHMNFLHVILYFGWSPQNVGSISFAHYEVTWCSCIINIFFSWELSILLGSVLWLPLKKLRPIAFPYPTPSSIS